MEFPFHHPIYTLLRRKLSENKPQLVAILLIILLRVCVYVRVYAQALVFIVGFSKGLQWVVLDRSDVQGPLRTLVNNSVCVHGCLVQIFVNT